jgi:N-acetylglucosamine kinase-like BadF-type ATPase
MVVTRYFLGVDGGGSKTAALVVDEKMKRRGAGIAGGSNHLRVGIEEATRNIERAINTALVEASIAITHIEFAYCGIAGADHPVHREKVVDSLRVFFPKGNFTVDNDARIALTGAIGPDAGIVVISGTGSVAFGRNAKGEEARAGGWGPTIGDEGSGYAIARVGLSAVVRAYDGRSPETKMTDILCKRYNMCHPADLPRVIYAPGTHTDDIAVYCKMVIEAAEDDDTIAKRILDNAGRELAKGAAAVAKRLNMLDAPFPVAYVGGAFNAARFVLDPMREVLGELAPTARLQPPNHTPVEGAAMMAIRASVGPRAVRPR